MRLREAVTVGGGKKAVAVGNGKEAEAYSEEAITY
jgi:hypothetical protein